MSEPSSQYWTYFDEAWKQIIERFFPEFLRFFAPEVYEAIDFQKSFTFLDTEMAQFDKQALKGAKVVDKLVKAFLKDGSEQWILIHIEVQGDADADFAQRMFRYFYRIYDRYGQRIISIAILTERASRTADGMFEAKLLGSGVVFHYLPFNLMGYERAALESDENPMAVVVQAAQERERLRRRGDGFNTKWYLTRKLYERGYSREEIIALFKFIDWVIQLSDEEEIRFRADVKTLEEVNKMPYITSVERIGRAEGLQEGLQQGLQQGLQELQHGLQQMLLDALDERFGELPAPVSDAIHKIQDQAQLRLLHRQAIRSASLEEFQSILNGN
jgi:hypothetical protein